MKGHRKAGSRIEKEKTKVTTMNRLDCALLLGGDGVGDGITKYGTSPAASNSRGATPAEARAIAKEAYIWGYALVDDHRIQYPYFIDKTIPNTRATGTRSATTRGSTRRPTRRSRRSTPTRSIRSSAWTCATSRSSSPCRRSRRSATTAAASSTSGAIATCSAPAPPATMPAAS